MDGVPGLPLSEEYGFLSESAPTWYLYITTAHFLRLIRINQTLLQATQPFEPEYRLA